MRVRFDLDQLDAEDPFEIDEGNRPHLYKHLPTRRGRSVPVGAGEILDVYLLGDPAYFEAREDDSADWIMIGEAPGLTLLVPLAPPNSGDPTKCRPIGLYAAGHEQVTLYRQGW